MNDEEKNAPETNNLGPPLISSLSLDSIRYLGLTTTDAICELIDNSLDASAENINVQIFAHTGGISITVEDDGEGIEPERVAEVLSFGGRVDRNRQKSIGRFGWGLPSAACCQAPRTEIFSKVQGGEWYTSYIDLNELSKMKQARLPIAEKKAPPRDLPLKLRERSSGTVVWLRDCDSLDYTDLNRLMGEVVSWVGETYRKYINAGKTIRVGNIAVVKSDPLMLLPGCWMQDQAGQGRIFQTIPPIVVEDVIDPVTGKPAEVEVKIAVLDWEHVWKQPNADEIRSKLGINIEEQGFYLMRHDRQIGRAQSFWLYTKHNDFNYFRGEISFPPVLDDYFGVQTNKSRFSLDRSLRDQLNESMKGVFGAIRKSYKDFIKQTEAKAAAPGMSKSEEAAAKGESLLKKSRFPIDPAQLAAVRAEQAKEKEQLVSKVKADTALTPEQKTREIQRIQNMFQFVRPFRRAIEASESSDFYVLRPKGDQTTVVINMNHPFYRKVYEKAVTSGMDSQLDLILFALAKAEYIAYDNEKYVKFYEIQKKEWSTILSVYLEEFQEDESET